MKALSEKKSALEDYDMKKVFGAILAVISIGVVAGIYLVTRPVDIRKFADESCPGLREVKCTFDYMTFLDTPHVGGPSATVELYDFTGDVQGDKLAGTQNVSGLSLSEEWKTAEAIFNVEYREKYKCKVIVKQDINCPEAGLDDLQTKGGEGNSPVCPLGPTNTPTITPTPAQGSPVCFDTKCETDADCGSSMVCMDVTGGLGPQEDKRCVENLNCFSGGKECWCYESCSPETWVCPPEELPNGEQPPFSCPIECGDPDGCPAPDPGTCKPKGNPCNPCVCWECRYDSGELTLRKCKVYNPITKKCDEWGDDCSVGCGIGLTPTTSPGPSEYVTETPSPSVTGPSCPEPNYIRGSCL